MLNIKKSTYGKYSSSNYGADAVRIGIGSLTLWFSYDTVVAFQGDGRYPLCISENCWGPTTEKHLNAIDYVDEYPQHKKDRMKRADFENALAEILKAHGLDI